MQILQRNLLDYLVILMIGLLVIVGVVFILPAVADAQEGGEIGAQATVGAGFTYQGRLLDNGSPVNDTCDFQFVMYDDETVGSGTLLTQVGVTANVDDGYFSTVLDFDSTYFQGEARWLEIFVRCPSTVGNYTQLNSRRVSLTPAPYALGLRPGAVVSGTGIVFAAHTSTNSGYALKGEASATDGNVSGIYGETKAPSGAGVVGYNTGSASGYGVYALATASSGTGVYGEAPATGIHGKITGDSGSAVFGEVSSSSGNGMGVHGVSNAENGYGVYGSNTNSGGYGVYSNGNAHVNGGLDWSEKTSYISVSAAAFRPSDAAFDYDNFGDELTSWEEDVLAAYEAPVQLPHNATVTKLTFYWEDRAENADGECVLYRNNLDGSNSEMAKVSSTGYAGYGNTYTDTISYDQVNNSSYAYYLEWKLVHDSSAGVWQNVDGLGVVIEYTFTQPY